MFYLGGVPSRYFVFEGGIIRRIGLLNLDLGRNLLVLVRNSAKKFSTHPLCCKPNNENGLRKPSSEKTHHTARVTLYFCPQNYQSLEVGRKLRDSTLSAFRSG